MNIEDLTKSQLVLLTVLVTFVTSVATGILTVSLLDEAPPIVTKTVNQIVEHTVEKIVQATPATVIQAPKPSVEDLITAAFAAEVARAITFYDPTVSTSTPIASGTYLSKAKAAIAVSDVALPKEALVGFSNGERISASLSHTDGTITVYGFADDVKLPATLPLTLIAAKDLKLGQTALALTPDGGAAIGIVSKVADGRVMTTLPQTAHGTAVIDLGGNLIGVSSGVEPGVFLSADKIRELLNATSTSPAT